MSSAAARQRHVQVACGVESHLCLRREREDPVAAGGLRVELPETARRAGHGGAAGEQAQGWLAHGAGGHRCLGRLAGHQRRTGADVTRAAGGAAAVGFKQGAVAVGAGIVDAGADETQRRGSGQAVNVVAGPFPALAAISPGQYRSTNSLVFRIFPRLDAPNTIDAMFGCWQTHSIASRGGMAPDANTDMAMARNLFSRSALA